MTLMVTFSTRTALINSVVTMTTMDIITRVRKINMSFQIISSTIRVTVREKIAPVELYSKRKNILTMMMTI